MNNNSKATVALLTGLAAGTALGLLLAPEKGIDIRGKVLEALRSFGYSIKNTAVAEIDNFVTFKDKFVDNIKEKMYGTEEEYQDDLEHA